MADPDELARAKFLREKQEYLDARLAYEEALNNAAMRMPIPTVAKASYSASDGPQRAATDPWIAQNHPDLKAAASRLLSEERQYLALDEPVSNHAQKNCSIVQYTAEKFYEYAALGEMLYKLATDEKFRNEITGKLGKLVEEGGLISDILIAAGAGMVNSPEAVMAEGMSDRVARANDDLREAGRAATSRLAGRISSYFSEKWAAFKKGWEECGLANAVARSGVDGLFMAGEIAIGGAVLKGFKFAYRLTKEGLHSVSIVSIKKGTIGSFGWTKQALENKYGKPDQNQVAGILTDKNRSVPNAPAEKPPAKTQPAKNEVDKSAQRMRSDEELLPGGKVPTASSGKFNKWWNDLSPDELDKLWKNPDIREDIAAQVRQPGGLHEWLMVKHGPNLKRMGFSMDEIKAMTSATKKIEGPVPGANGERWRHTTEEGKTGSGSKRMHNALDAEIAAAKNREDLLRRLKTWSESWLDNGVDSFPPALRDAIKGL
jgi:hypothetical protein